MKSLFYKVIEAGKDLFKCLMIYYNAPLSGGLQSLMQIFQSKGAKSDLPMSNAARQQLGLQAEKLRNVNKNEHLPSHDLHVEQDVMYQDVTSKQWYPATITSLCVQPRSYNITTREGVTYRKTQADLKPYQVQSKKSEDEHSGVQSSDMWILKANCMQCDNKSNQVNLFLDQRKTLIPQLNLICEVLSELFDNKLDVSCLKRIAHKQLPNRE